MKKTALYRALVGFRIVLCVTLLYTSVTTLVAVAIGAATGSRVRLEVVLLAASQALGALLLLLPLTRRMGGALLLCSLGAAFVICLLRHETRLYLLVYIAGAVLVMVHDAALRSAQLQPDSPRAG